MLSYQDLAKSGRHIHSFVRQKSLFVLGAFGAFACCRYLASAILLASPIKTRRYCGANKMLQKATTKNTNIYICIIRS